MKSWTVLFVASFGLVGCFSKPSFQGGQDGGVDAPINPDTFIDPRGPQRLAAGNAHACAITNSGQLRCWGDNSHGQLGVESTAHVEVPSEVGSVAGWTAISAGSVHTCGVRAGVAYCWGGNDDAEVGGTGQVVTAPQQVPFGFSDFTVENIAALDRATCAVGKRGGVDHLYCWGVVDATEVSVDGLQTPTLIGANPANTKWTKVVGAGGHRCALRDDGAVFCWGVNALGQTGQPKSATVSLASATRFGSQVYIDIAAGEHSTCGVTATNRLFCWGADGENIAPPAEDGKEHEPREVLPAGGAAPQFRTIAIGFNHACVTDLAGAVACFGQDDTGAMGYQTSLREGFEQDSATPRPVTLVASGTAPAAVSLVTGTYFSCMRTTTGAPVLCWGSQSHGQLGIGNHARTELPSVRALDLPASMSIVSISAGRDHTCVGIRRPNTQIENSCWGKNFDSQVTGMPNDNTSALIDRAVDPSGYFSTRLVAGAHNSCSIVPGENNVACWGNNQQAQLGIATPTATNHTVPVEVTTSQWTLVATDGDAACGVERNMPGTTETLRCWGMRFGQTSDDRTMYMPQVGVGTPFYEGLAMGNGFGAAVVRPTSTPINRAVMTWGEGRAGQLAPGAMLNRGDLQTAITIPDEATNISLAPAGADGAHTCVGWMRSGTGTVQCWGSDSAGQLGVNQFGIGRPAFEAGFEPTKVVTAENHSCALSTDGRIFCWGNGNELGSDNELGATPRQFGGANQQWADLATGRHHTCAITMDRRAVQCWGTSEFGQFGNGSRFHPDPVAALVPR